jgi:glycosyltransferase involved in cell wall biosynthesis
MTDTPPLVLIDADTLGRHRTGDETYIQQLLENLPALGDDLRYAAVTRHPELVPANVQAIRLGTRSQELRMAVRMPLLLRRVRPALAHFLHALPPLRPCPAIVTVQDISFESDASAMPRKDRLVFKAMVPRAVRGAAAVLTISERSRGDIIEAYGVPAAKVVSTPLGVDPIFTPGEGEAGDYLLVVGAVEPRKNPLAAALAAQRLGKRLIVAGPIKDDALADKLRVLGAELRGYVTKDELVELYRGAECFLFPSRYEGFGLPPLEAMACGTPVVCSPDPALREIGVGAALFASDDELAGAVETILGDRESYVRASLARARAYSWQETARRVKDVYLRVLSGRTP